MVHSTNEKIQKSLDLMTELRKEGLLTPEPFDEPIEFIAFDLCITMAGLRNTVRLWVAQILYNGMEITNYS